MTSQLSNCQFIFFQTFLPTSRLSEGFEARFTTSPWQRFWPGSSSPFASGFSHHIRNGCLIIHSPQCFPIVAPGKTLLPASLVHAVALMVTSCLTHEPIFNVHWSTRIVFGLHSVICPAKVEKQRYLVIFSSSSMLNMRPPHPLTDTRGAPAQRC